MFEFANFIFRTHQVLGGITELTWSCYIKFKTVILIQEFNKIKIFKECLNLLMRSQIFF